MGSNLLFVTVVTVLAGIVSCAADESSDATPDASACGRLEEPECEGTLGCEPLHGQARGSTIREYAGCRYSGTGGNYLLCNTVYTCAYPRGDQSRCLRFPSSCIPPTWTRATCGEGACPSLSGE